MRKIILLLAVGMFLVSSRAVFAETGKLAFEQGDNGSYTFDTGILRGVLRSEGRSIGLLSLEHIPSGSRLDGNDYGVFSHYRVFTANKRYGDGAWYLPSTSQLHPDGSVEISWPASEECPFELKALYRLSAPDTLDLTTSVTAHSDLKAFESFLASYFTEAFPASSVYALGDGKDTPSFQTTEQEQGHWQAFPRDREAVAIIQDGRWKIEPNPVDWVIRGEATLPLALRRNPQTGVCAVVMARPEDCFAVMTPYAAEGHRSLYLSLFGRDIKASETAAARARLVVRPLSKDEEAVSLYEAYIKEVQR